MITAAEARTRQAVSKSVSDQMMLMHIDGWIRATIGQGDGDTHIYTGLLSKTVITALEELGYTVTNVTDPRDHGSESYKISWGN